ncbi:MAG: hypothetical protein QOE14_795, partial [Humisphaera sp.]|nr:hypothetical protein [Humisphaera sp.]
MQIGGTVQIFLAAVVLFISPIALAQTVPASAPVADSPTIDRGPAPAEVPAQPPAASLTINGTEASTWASADRGGASVIQVQGPVTIQIEKTTLTAKAAVVWIEAARGPNVHPGDEQITVALLGDAKVQTPDMTRSGDRLIVTARVNGPIRISADDRQARDLSNTETFKSAQLLREQSEAQAAQTPAAPDGAGAGPANQRVHLSPRTLTTRAGADAGAGVTTRPVAAPVRYKASDIRNITASNGKMALALSGGVVLSREDADGNHLEMQADRAVIFTTLNRLGDIKDMQDVRRTEEAITAAYLEGDVRVNITPAKDLQGEQRLEAEHVYYDFTTDRAVLTDAVLHTVDAQRNLPIIIRADTLRQLSEREYRANRAELTTSGFAVPSYSIRAGKAYVRQVETGDDRYGTRTTFQASDVTMRTFGLPFFYLPAVAGTVTERGSALRELSLGQSSTFGTSVETRWGLFETFGQVPPEKIDATYRLDYYGKRGPAGGIDAEYSGGFISNTTKQAWNFEGELESYFVNDHGTDILGRRRAHIDPEETFRGRVRWEHQHFFPEDWQLQLRSGWVSDPTFMEEWFEDEFDERLPLETSLYLKRQHDSEAMTFLTTVQPNNVVTSADLTQEQFEVERFPEFG